MRSGVALMSSVAVGSALLLGCTSESKGTAQADSGPGRVRDTGQLAAVAVKELEALGYRKYEGKAVIEREMPPEAEAPARVSFDPESGPICLSGDPFAAYYMDRQSNDLVILLDGGGACWSGFCSSTSVVDQRISEFARHLAFPAVPAPRGTNSSAPVSGTGMDFRTWNAVSIPYCDGSVFMGDNDFLQPDGAIRHHHGRQNLAAGLDLATDHFPNARRVLLVGWSAGGYGTLTAMMSTRLRYPDAELYVLDDSGLGVFNLAEATDMEQRLDEWRYGELIPASCTECNGGHGQLAPLFSWMFERDQNIRVGAASYFQDGTISRFLRMQPSEFETLLRGEMAAVHDAHPDRFKRFMLSGATHVLSQYWETITAGGTRFDAWTTTMADRDDATWTDIQADCAYACCQTDGASCKAAPGCSEVLGRDAPDHPDTFVSCIPTAGACDVQITCAIPPERDRCLQFPNGCIPSGWQAAGCGSIGCPGNPIVAVVPDCDLPTVIAHVTGGAPSLDCGAVHATSSEADKARAIACVTTAQTASQPYEVSWTEPSPPESPIVLGASLGVVNGDDFRLYHFDHSQQNPPSSSWTTCSRAGVETCTDDNKPLCLSCAPDGVAGCKCQVSPFGNVQGRSVITCN